MDDYGNEIGKTEQPMENLESSVPETMVRDQLSSAINVKDYGLIINDITKATQNTTILKNLFLNSDNPVLLPPGTIYFNDELVMGVGVKVYATPRSILNLINKNVNGIVVNDKTVIEDLTIVLPQGFTKTAVLLDGTKHINTATARNLRIEGYSYGGTYTGTAIKISAMAAGSYVCFVDYSNIYLKWIDYGIVIEDSQATAGGWANGNRFKNVSIIGNRGVNLTGKPSGNEVNLQFQTVSNTVAAIYCEGKDNYFSGMIWDIDRYGSKAKIAILTRSSNHNVLSLSHVYTEYITDDGTDNIFIYNTSDSDSFKPLNTNSNYTVYPDGFNINVPVFHGIQDNCLAYINKTAAINISGNISYNPGVQHIFDSKYVDHIIFRDPGITPIVLEIDTSKNPIDDMYLFGMTFWYAAAPSAYKIDLVTTSGGAYSNWLTVSNNRKTSIVHMLSRYGLNIYKIKITITGAISTSSVNANKEIWLSSVFGCNNGKFFASPFLFRDGGIMYGDIEFGDIGKGVILRTPDGTKKYRLSIDNSGNITTVLIP